MGNPEKSIGPTAGVPLPANNDVLGENGGKIVDGMAEGGLKMDLDFSGLLIDETEELRPIFFGLDRFEQEPTDTCYKVPPSCFCGSPHWAFMVNERKVFQDVEYAVGSVVNFHEESCSGTPSYGILGKEQDVQGMRLATGTEVDFHSNGRLGTGTLATPQNIDGLMCEGKIYLYENGKIRMANLAETTTIHGMKFKAGQTGFIGDGAVDFGRLTEDQVIQGIPCAGDNFISFTRNWQLEHVLLAEDTVINGVLFRKGVEISFDEGKVRYAKQKLESDTIVYGDVIPKGSALSLDSEGTVTGISLSKMTTIHGIQCEYSRGVASGDVEYYKNGRISSAELGREQVIGNKKLPRDTKIFFDEDGKIRSVDLPRTIHDLHFWRGTTTP